MKYISLCFFIGYMLLFAVQTTAAEKIKIGYFELKPHSYNSGDKHKPKGATIAYFKKIAEHMGYEVEWIGPLPFPRLLLYCKDGKIDGATVIIGDAEWERTIFYYPDSSYKSFQAILAVNKANPLKIITSSHDIEGYRIGFIRKAAPSKFIRDNIDQIKIETIPGDTWLKQNLRKLIVGRIDAVHDLNADSVFFMATVLNLADQIKILPLPEPPQKCYIGFSRNSTKGKVLVEQYNKTVRQLQLNYEDFLKQEYDAISQQE